MKNINKKQSLQRMQQTKVMDSLVERLVGNLNKLNLDSLSSSGLHRCRF
ncbi:MAG: hypothetical protein HRU03_01260 [Nanoarchaeales archaeon]|nr:hypothetical protein [Nanoarchaeales archaeon]